MKEEWWGRRACVLSEDIKLCPLLDVHIHLKLTQIPTHVVDPPRDLGVGKEDDGQQGAKR